MSGSSDRIKGALEAIIRHVFARIDYFAYYRAQIVAQDSDGTLQVQPDDTRFPGLTGVPIRYGLPGFVATLDLSQPAYCFVGFEAGNPGRPFALIWESATVATLTFDNGALKVARTTDAVNVGTLAGTAGPWPVIFTFTPLLHDGSAGAPVVGQTPTVTAVIPDSSGNSKFKVS